MFNCKQIARRFENCFVTGASSLLSPAVARPCRLHMTHGTVVVGLLVLTGCFLAEADFAHGGRPRTRRGRYIGDGLKTAASPMHADGNVPGVDPDSAHARRLYGSRFSDTRRRRSFSDSRRRRTYSSSRRRRSTSMTAIVTATSFTALGATSVKVGAGGGLSASADSWR